MPDDSRDPRDRSGNIDQERLEKLWNQNYNTPEHYHVHRTEFGHGQKRRMPPIDTEDYEGRENYIGRDYENNAGYRENYNSLHEGLGFDDERILWRRREEELYRKNISYRGKGPRSYKRSDERIKEDVHDTLRDDPYVDATHIKIDVEDGEVILSGIVDDRSAKRRAEDLCDYVLGVKNVENRLHLKQNAGLEFGT